MSPDLQAGFAVAVLGLPQCLAYAMMAGLPPAYGLSTVAVAGLAAALLGRSAQVATGPTNTTGLLVLAALTPFLADNGLLDPARLGVLVTLTLLAGAIRVLVALLGGAHLVRFLPDSVLVGFTAGAGVLIVAMQLDEALGLEAVKAPGMIAELQRVVASLPEVRLPAAAVAVGTLALLVVGRRRFPRVPAALIAIVVAAVGAALLGLDQASGLPLVQDRAVVPTGWPPGTWPDLGPSLVQQLIGPACAIVLLGTLELTVTARAAGARPDLRREILAQGWANAASALAAGMPASASLTRSAFLRQSGARTRLAAASAAVFTVPVLLLVGHLVGRIPQSCLAGVLFSIAWRMMDRRAMRRLWNASAETRLLLVVSFVATLVLPLEWAILVGSGAGLVLHLARTSAPRLRLLRPQGERLVPVAPGEEPGRVVVEVSGDLHYAAVPPFLSEAETLVPPAARGVVLDLSHAHEIRYAALRAFEELAAQVAARGGRLVLAGVDQPTRSLVTRSGSELPVVASEIEPGGSVRRALDELPPQPAIGPASA